MSGAELLAAGCRKWDVQDDIGAVLYLFPVAWFDEIPARFVVTAITGERKQFSREMSRDQRFGVLAFGVLA